MRLATECNCAGNHHPNCPEGNDDMPDDELETWESEGGAVDPTDDQQTEWLTMVSRILRMAMLPEATKQESGPYWHAGLTPLAAAARICDDRDREACDATE